MRTRQQERLTYTVEEVGEMLGISRCNAYALVREGKLPAIRIGKRRWVIPKKRIEELLNS